jgi:hypothetical protein
MFAKNKVVKKKEQKRVDKVEEALKDYYKAVKEKGR